MARLHVTSSTELAIDLGDGRRFAVHPLWLRERCLDPETFDLRTGQRLSDPSDLYLKLSLTSVSEPEPGPLAPVVELGRHRVAVVETRQVIPGVGLPPAAPFDGPSPLARGLVTYGTKPHANGDGPSNGAEIGRAHA